MAISTSPAIAASLVLMKDLKLVMGERSERRGEGGREMMKSMWKRWSGRVGAVLR